MRHAWLVVVAAALALSGCSKRDVSERPGPPAFASEGPAACAPAEPVVDPTLLAFLSKARAAHHEADLAEESGDTKLAIGALERVTHGPIPGGESHALPEAAEVVGDTCARLADLRSAGGDFPGALADVDHGLAIATETTHFRGHLFEVKGIVLERLAKSVRATDRAASERAKKQAIEAYDTAMQVQDEVIGKALGRPDGGP